MTAREDAERELSDAHHVPGKTRTGVRQANATAGVGYALLDLADAVREFLAAPRPELRGFLETPWGQATVSGVKAEDVRDRTIDGGVQRGEPAPERQLDEDPRRLVHWNAGGDDSLACGSASGYNTRVVGDVTCVPCSRLSDVAAECNAARARISDVEAQLDRWVVEGDGATRVSLSSMVAQLRTLIRVEGCELAPLSIIEVPS